MTNTDIQKPDWNYWRQRGAATLPEAVLLSLDIEPRHFAGYEGLENNEPFAQSFLINDLDKCKPGIGQQFADRLAMAKRELESRKWR